LFLSAKPEKTNCQFLFAQIRVNSRANSSLDPHSRAGWLDSEMAKQQNSLNSSLNRKTGSCFYRRSLRKPTANFFSRKFAGKTLPLHPHSLATPPSSSAYFLLRINVTEATVSLSFSGNSGWNGRKQANPDNVGIRA
jgi:hypothetical protein